MDQFPLFGTDRRYQWSYADPDVEKVTRQLEYSRITLSPLGHFLYVGDGGDSIGTVDRIESHLMSIALTVDAIDEPELTPSLTNKSLGFQGVCERLVETRRQYEEAKAYFERNRDNPDLFTSAQRQMFGETNGEAMETVLEASKMGIRISGRALARGLNTANSLGTDKRDVLRDDNNMGALYEAASGLTDEFIELGSDFVSALNSAEAVQDDLIELTQIAFDYDEADFWSSVGRNVLSFVINFTPLGTAKDIFDAIIGYDSLTLQKLEVWERVLNIATSGFLHR